MKTSVIEVHDMLSVLTVDEVEKWIGKVPGVASAPVNYAAKNATMRNIRQPNKYGVPGIILRMTIGRNAWLY